MLDVRAPVRRAIARPLIAWVALVAVAVAWGRVLVSTHHHLDLGAPPFWSPFELHVTWRVLPALAIGAIVVQVAPVLARSLPWRRLLAVTAVATTLWALAVAFIDSIHGVDALTDPVRLDRNDYLQTAHQIGSLHTFLARFADVL